MRPEDRADFEGWNHSTTFPIYWCGAAQRQIVRPHDHKKTVRAMTSEPYWNPMVPELTVTSLEASLRFYLAAGFSVRFSRAGPPFAYLELGHAQLMLEQQYPEGWNIEPLDRPLGRGINFQIEVPSAEKVLAELGMIGVPIYREIRDTWYRTSPQEEEGQREFLVQDPDGYLLRFAEYLGTRSAA